MASRLAAATVLTAAALVGFGFFQVAHADYNDPDCWVDTGDDVEYVCHGDDDGEDGGDGDGGGGGGDPTCDLSIVEGRSNAHCRGELACWANIPSALPEEEWPEDERPSEDAVYVFVYCYNADGSYHDSWWDWHTPDEPSLPDEAWQAYGRLEFPEFTLKFSPIDRSLVDVDTWYWVDGPSADPIEGTSAAGMVAIATPRHIEVDPGDGSGVMTCEWTVEESDACAHVYSRASTNGSVESADGEPAYEGRARLVYDIHFEFEGSSIELPGLPDEFTTDWESTAIPVAESQSVVVRGDDDS
ncbi:hypothetical protein EF847_04710 [Actinobacteria bacterium YIM 96077]|uniref:Uncharacterized protein n=2 Tax=Phytoactinopolyspora halophila TaxID=1981511 RepID=A0A329R552_9ACTN|nr:hypothetical protein EF847_04710 [Actinobacteria bacterium YIM 96077]RAW18652.1 hypothetical protein DPM12_00805 [Phytoactinopolyspora halophila]